MDNPTTGQQTPNQQPFAEPTVDTEVQQPFAPPQPPEQPVQSIFEQPTVQPAQVIPPQQENPFIPPTVPPQSSGASVAIKKILAVVVLLIALGAVLFLIITIVQKVLKKNENITLTYWGLWEDDVIIKPLIDEYQKAHTTIKISYVKESKEQYRTRLQATIAKSSTPDIFRFHNTWVPMLKDVLSVAPKTILSADEFKKTFYPVAQTDLIVKDRKSVV